LRSISGGPVFGAGDCVGLEGHALPKLGVYGVRQGPILADNLLASVTGAPLKVFRPQKRSLIILNLGCGDGLALWGALHWYGRSSLLLKDRIDRRFLMRYRSQ